MSKRGELMNENEHVENFLKHYGVLGMRWGVRRSPDQLRRAAGKLDSKRDKLQTKYVKIQGKAAKKRSKAYGRFTSQDKSEERIFEANKLEAKGKKYLSKMMKNEQKSSIFNNTANALDEGKVLAGNRFVMKYEKATLKKQL